jgi:hypothetical protein
MAANNQASMTGFESSISSCLLDLDGAVTPCWVQHVKYSSEQGYSAAAAAAAAPAAIQIRRVLVNLGLPGAGTPVKLQQRALAVAEAVAAGKSLNDAVEVARKLR